jgi:hypothetical protein
LQTVSKYLAQNPDSFDLILFNVFTPRDFEIYQEHFPKVFPSKPLQALLGSGPVGAAAAAAVAAAPPV